jgi:hypothetical protein
VDMVSLSAISSGSMPEMSTMSEIIFSDSHIFQLR